MALRNVRKDIMKKIDKVEFSKDTKKDLEDAIQKLTDAYVKKVMRPRLYLILFDIGILLWDSRGTFHGLWLIFHRFFCVKISCFMLSHISCQYLVG